jgi:hypothetical protein
MPRRRILLCLALTGGLAFGAALVAPAASADPPPDSRAYLQYVTELRTLPGFADAPTRVLFDLGDMACGALRRDGNSEGAYAQLHERGLDASAAAKVVALAVLDGCREELPHLTSPDY